MKKLIPAIVLLLVSAIVMSTASYAWFSMNTVVTANNMEVKAVAEQGLLINEVATAADANWDADANTTASGAISLHATSTANTSTWYVAYSKDVDNSASATAGTASTNLTTDGYKVLGTDLTTAVQTVAATAGSVAGQTITYVDTDGTAGYANGEGYYVKYTYYLKSSADAITLTTAGAGRTLNIKSVTATPKTTNSENLDKALRVAIVVGGKAYIYAPISGATGSYYVNASSTATTVLTGEQPTALTSVPASTADGTPVDVYLYFEGEDTNLKTTNAVSTLDEISVEVVFELATNAAAVTDNGVAIS